MAQGGGDIMLDAVAEQAGSARQSEARPQVRLQRVILDRPTSLRDLYWRRSREDGHMPGAVGPDTDGTLLIEPGTTVAFDTYFNALFEHHWRLHTRAASFSLHVEIEGCARLRLWRVTEHGGQTLLHEVEAGGTAVIALPQDTANFRQAGMVWFELTAVGSAAVLRRAEWFATDAAPEPVGLAVAICTFNREADLAGVLAAIAGDPALGDGAGGVARVFVVSQGRPGLLAHPDIAPQAARLGARLRVIEQGNFGGAGGFGRALLEALDDDAVTHVAFLDDDVRLEPESLLRMAAFFALARGTQCLGGHMLDAVRPTNLYEGGAVLRDNWAPIALSHQLDLRSREVLVGLLDVQAMHYSGWWFFGFPKRLAEEHGMPLPCFIRGDDVEWGMRLYGRGVPTVSLPGVGIWHEPFYLKSGGWQLYYETRNALICAALHMDFSPRHAARQLLTSLMAHLLTYRYYSAALIVRAAEDFLRGPAILDADPQALHASLATLRALHPEGTVGRDVVLWDAPVAATPHTRLRTGAALGAVLLRNWRKPSSATARPRRLPLRDLVWFRMAQSDALAIETHWERELPLFRRDRARFRLLLRAGLRVVRALYAAAPRLRAAWAQEAPRMTSVSYWRTYLGLSRRG
jgi:galactofuranosylgalactofuranosylrhamnosyl-N-acetylglucosaminyl-diphospho-decaprenol beta-1,5/1,6-galactofuranosyltransferase